jgi:hypothetical protein
MVYETELFGPNHTVDGRQLHQFHQLPVALEVHLVIDGIVIHGHDRYGTILEVNLGMNELLEYEYRIVLSTSCRNDEADPKMKNKSFHIHFTVF